MTVKCPLCGHEAKQGFNKHGHWIYICNGCGHYFADIPQSSDHAEQVYDDGYFFEGGDGYEDYLSEADLLIAHGERYGDLLKKYRQAGTVLDVGAAAGFILKGLTHRGWTGKGIEPNPTVSAYARDQLGLDVQTGTLEQFSPDRKVDVVTMVQVIAHFYDVRQALQVAHNALKSDGLMLIET